MATFTATTDLTLKVGSNVDQPNANQKLRNLLRDSVSAGQGLLQGVAPEGTTAPTVSEIQTMSTAQLKPWAQRMMRGFVRDLAKSYRVQAAEATHVAPVRSAPDETEDAG